MSKYRLWAMAGSTLCCAIGIGVFMETVSARPSDPIHSPAKSASVALKAPVAVQGGPVELPLQDITLTSALPEAEPTVEPAKPRETVHLAAATTHAVPRTPRDPDMPRLGCAVKTDARAVADAHVLLSINAPCSVNERVTIHHQGMMFTEVTDASGSVLVRVPALQSSAVFVVSFANGGGTVARTNVPDLHAYDRVVLQWADRTGFELHAREFGAGYGEDGHVWNGSKPSSGTGHMARLGRVSTLVPQLAEVYTFPRAAASVDGTIALSVETEVTTNNCARDIEAQVLQIGPRETLRTRDIVLTMPDCSAVGDFLVLNNVLDDLKIASN